MQQFSAPPPVGHAGFNGLIELAENGFWRVRFPPTPSLARTAALFNAIGGKVIVEIGSGLQGEMSGNSVLVWAHNTLAKKIYALDLDQKHINDVKAATSGFPAVEAILGDGLEFVRSFTGRIDLLYLDFWTPDVAGKAPGTGRQDAYLQAFELARDKLAERSLILIDDTDHVHPWKHTLIVPEACRHGFREIWQGRQTLLVR